MSDGRQLPLVWRRWALLGLMMTVAFALAARAYYIQVWDNSRLLERSEAIHKTKLELAATRGMILDRSGEPLAVSTPVETVAVNPRRFLAQVAPTEGDKLAKILGLDAGEMWRRIEEKKGRGSYYLKRHVSPEVVAKVRAMKLKGVTFDREYKRFYPMGEVMGHVVGFTNVDDEGQEGVELAYNDKLRGVKGSMWVKKDRRGAAVEDMGRYIEPRPGRDVTLSLDKRVQYLAYRELKAAVQQHEARSASAVLLDIKTGEVLAVVNQPSFNPNNRATFKSYKFRNRAVTDVFEPGSTMKPFTVVAALEAGKIGELSTIDTSPGLMRIGGNTIRDAVNYGVIDVRTVLQKSSNVGTSKIALSITAEELWKTFDRVGLGISTGSQFPGEADGNIGDYWLWKEMQQASRSYGYGMSVSALQLARAYAVLANDGIKKPVSFLKLDEAPAGERVMDADIARKVRKMLESVVEVKGTGNAAAVPGYRVAGKTGTVHKTSSSGYADDKYSAMFAGVAPATHPRLALVVVVHEPQRNEYHGGKVAAPVFSKIMSGALRLLNVAPDDLELKNLSAGLAGAGVGGVH